MVLFPLRGPSDPVQERPLQRDQGAIVHEGNSCPRPGLNFKSLVRPSGVSIGNLLAEFE